MISIRNLLRRSRRPARSAAILTAAVALAGAALAPTAAKAFGHHGFFMPTHMGGMGPMHMGPMHMGRFGFRDFDHRFGFHGFDHRFGFHDFDHRFGFHDFHHRFRRHFAFFGFGFAPSFVDTFAAYPYDYSPYYDPGCVQLRRVWNGYRWVWRSYDVCY